MKQQLNMDITRKHKYSFTLDNQTRGIFICGFNFYSFLSLSFQQLKMRQGNIWLKDKRRRFSANYKDWRNDDGNARIYINRD